MTGLAQPTTALQLARREGVTLDRAGYLFWELACRHLVDCLNATARKSRLYWLTEMGCRCQTRLRKTLHFSPVTHELPPVDWFLYGWLCFRHRAAIVAAMNEPLQPATIKRRARQRDQTLRMSANNVRDVMKLFLRRGVVRKVNLPREHHPRYQLTRAGRTFRALLLNAGTGVGVPVGAPVGVGAAA